MHVVATAGHVDHGKSTLVLALTGTDPDRFAEEKARGLTIDLGFACTTLPVGPGAGFVDVPGHVRFIKNMLAGVGAVDACLFVVAATEGWKPQSEEHLRILELLGVAPRRGGPHQGRPGRRRDRVELARLEVADHVAGTFLEGAEVVAVDAPDRRRRADDLRAALDRLLGRNAGRRRPRPAPAVGRPVFAARGSGTVVTGTLAGGALRRRRRLVVLAGRRRHGPGPGPADPCSAGATGSGPGHRVAVNLAGVAHDEVARGDALVAPGSGARRARFDASLHVLAALDHEVTRRGAYSPTWARASTPVRLRVLGADGHRPGQDGLVRLHLPSPLPLLPGDRFVLRESGRRRDRRRRRGARRGAGAAGVEGPARPLGRSGRRRAGLGRRRTSWSA